MYFINEVKKKYKNNQIEIYVDMDGVLADYSIYNPYDFKNKRPVKTTINIISELSKLKNVSINILSICKKNEDILLKKEWLRKYTEFINQENCYIISKEDYPISKSKELKLNFLKSKLTPTSKIILIDDDNEILHFIKNNLPEVDVYQDSSIID